MEYNDSLTVGELIDKLKKFDSKEEVWLSGKSLRGYPIKEVKKGSTRIYITTNRFLDNSVM